ncbi:MAG: hypothetical protein HOQ24_03895 [Mycobacteriaceae bacterium]|nr:hypothetical protein [Mycobacteriaceae bacterium]
MTTGRDLQPTTTIHGHLQFTHSGLVHATYFVTALPYGLCTANDKLDVRRAHRDLLDALPDGSLLLGLQARVDTIAVLRRMVRGVDLDSCENYGAEVVACYDRLNSLTPRTRIFLLSVPVGVHSRAIDLPAPLRHADTLSGSRIPTPADLSSYLSAADTIASRVGREFALAPVSACAFVWLWEHCLTRGVGGDPAPPTPDAQPNGEATAALFCAAVLDEDGAYRTPGGRLAMLKVLTPACPTRPIHQILLTPQAFPYVGLPFPGGSEFLHDLDGLPVGTADWGMRVARTTADTDGGEPRISVTSVVAVGGPTQDAAAAAARVVQLRCRHFDIELVAPAGEQVGLWSLLVPGSSVAPAVARHAHVMPAQMWSGLVPFAACGVGDAGGPVIGFNLLSGLLEPIHLDVLSAPAFAIAGDPGPETSFFLHYLATLVRDVGGRVIVIGDAAGWALRVEAGGRGIVIEPAAPVVSLDPLRIHPPHTAAERTVTLLRSLLDLGPADRATTLLTELLTPAARARHRVATLPDLFCLLRNGSADPDDRLVYAELTSRLTEFVDRAAVLFDRALPPWRMTDVTVLRGPHPRTAPPARPSARDRLEHALAGLVAAAARDEFLTEDGRLGLLLCDHPRAVAATPEGLAVLTDFFRDGARHRASIGLFCADPDVDFPRGCEPLVGTRFVFRHRDREQARRSLRWLGTDLDLDLDATVFGLLSAGRDAVTPRGDVAIRDRHGRIGFGRILGPARVDVPTR